MPVLFYRCWKDWNQRKREKLGHTIAGSHYSLLWLRPASARWQVCSVLQFEKKPPWACRECPQGWDLFCMYVHVHACTHTLFSSAVSSMLLPEPGTLRWQEAHGTEVEVVFCKTDEKSGAKFWHIFDRNLRRMGAAISHAIIDEPSNKLLQTNNSGPDPEEKCPPTHPDATQNMHRTAFCVWNHRNSLSHTMIGTIHHKLETCPLFQSCTWGLKSNVTIFIITGAKVLSRKTISVDSLSQQMEWLFDWVPPISKGRTFCFAYQETTV